MQWLVNGVENGKKPSKPVKTTLFGAADRRFSGRLSDFLGGLSCKVGKRRRVLGKALARHFFVIFPGKTRRLKARFGRNPDHGGPFTGAT